MALGKKNSEWGIKDTGYCYCFYLIPTIFLLKKNVFHLVLPSQQNDNSESYCKNASRKQACSLFKCWSNPLPFLHREGLYPCIPPAQRIDSTPSCAWFSASLIESRALIWTLRVQLDSSQKDTGKELLSAKNGRTPLCPTSSFFPLCKKKPW